MKKKINIGVIGCGVVGLKRIINLPKTFRLIACADPYIFSKKNEFLKKKKNFINKELEKTFKYKKLRSCNNFYNP